MGKNKINILTKKAIKAAEASLIAIHELNKLYKVEKKENFIKQRKTLEVIKNLLG